MHWSFSEGYLRFSPAKGRHLQKILDLGLEDDIYQERLAKLVKDGAVFLVTRTDHNELIGYCVFYPIDRNTWQCERFVFVYGSTGIGAPSFTVYCMCDMALYETKKKYGLTLVSGLDIVVKVPPKLRHQGCSQQLLHLGFKRVGKNTFRRLLEDGISGTGAYRFGREESQDQEV